MIFAPISLMILRSRSPSEFTKSAKASGVPAGQFCSLPADRLNYRRLLSRLPKFRI